MPATQSFSPTPAPWRKFCLSLVSICNLPSAAAVSPTNSGANSRRSKTSLPSKSHLSTATKPSMSRSEEHTSELQSRLHLVCRLLLEKKNKTAISQSRIKNDKDKLSCDQ